MKRLFHALSVAVVAVALVVPSPVVAGEPTEQLRRQVDAVLQTLASPELKKEGRADARRAEIRKAAMRVFDFEETARRSLGRHWQSRTPTERQEFVKLFTDLIEHAYISKIDQYSGEKVVYSGETVDGDQATVKTKIQTPKGSDVPIEYRLHKAKDQWLVYDVVIEGVSLVGNYRTQFNKIIQTSSYEDLVQKLKTKSIGAPPEGTPRDRQG